MRRVVVGVDGSPSAVRALSWASAEARHRDAKLIVVHAWQAALAGLRTALSGAFDIASSGGHGDEGFSGLVALLERR